LTNSSIISSRRAPRILLSGGGTGGHVYPAVSIADAVREIEPRAVVEFAGSRTGIEWRLVPESGYAIHHVTVRGLERKLTARNLALPFVLARGFKEARDLVQHFDADVVVGTGGYVALPVLLAARNLHRRIAIQEQNAFMGLTNRIASRFADQIHLAFSEATPKRQAMRTRITGNPVRASLSKPGKNEARVHFKFTDVERVVFMTGGSMGSQAMNEAMAAVVRRLLAKKGTGVIWQTGARYYERFKTAVPDHPNLRLLEYVNRMDMAYAAADLVVCRSGASTCSELMLTGKPALLVPSPNVAEDHQTKNAESLVRAGAAEMISESSLLDNLQKTVETLLQRQAKLERMSNAIRELARPDASKEIAEDVLGLARTRIR